MIQFPEEPVGANAIEARIVEVLLPFFLSGAGGDEDVARAAIHDQIATYKPTSAPEILKVGRIVGLRRSAIDNLRLSVAGHASPEKIKRYWDAAVSLTREADNEVQALDELRAQRQRGASPATEDAEPAQAAAAVAAVPDSILCFLSSSR
jgi:hypothetical protein